MYFGVSREAYEESDGNSGNRFNTDQYDVRPADGINRVDLLVRINLAECKSDTSDKSPQV